MPIYDYACASCGTRFEHMQSGTAIIYPACPVCSGTNVSKLVSVPGLIRANNGSHSGHTCCGREERCDKPPCSNDGGCRRDH